MDGYEQFVPHRYGAAHGLPDRAVTRIARDGEVVYARADGAYAFDGERWAPVDESPFDGSDESPPDVDVPSRYPIGSTIPDTDGEVQCGGRDGTGALWVGTSRGVLVTRGGDRLFSFRAEPGGLPYHDVTSIQPPAEGGRVWVGFSEGAAALSGGRWRYFHGRRWLPDDHVNHVVADGDGGAWLATDGGVAHLEARELTLEEKAAHYEAINAARHNRGGFTTTCRLEESGDLDSYRHVASDNDGLWTALTVGAEACRYAVTGEEAARDLAWESMDAMLDLVRRTPGSGYPARAIAREEEDVLLSDADSGLWKESPDEGWLYKTDTSSDELVGHYFAWYCYHELVADEGEQAEIEAVCRAVTNRILDDGFLLLQPDGERTTWGVWAPEYLDDDPAWWRERALNSMEILSHLRVAMALCGDRRYRDAYEELIDEHGYLLNAAEGRVTEPPGTVNHSDDELWFVSYYPIGLLETDPGRRALIERSIERSWSTIRPERSPFYNVIYGAVTGNPCDADAAVESLKRWPWDLRDWTVRNSHRDDYELRSHRDRFDRLQSRAVLRPDERPGLMWNRNPYRLDGGREGRTEYDAAPFLLPYWLGRHHGVVPAPDQ